MNQLTNFGVRGGTAGGNVTVKNVSHTQNILNRASIGTAGQPNRDGYADNLPPLLQQAGSSYKV